MAQRWTNGLRIDARRNRSAIRDLAIFGFGDTGDATTADIDIAGVNGRDGRAQHRGHDRSRTRPELPPRSPAATATLSGLVSCRRRRDQEQSDRLRLSRGPRHAFTNSRHVAPRVERDPRERAGSPNDYDGFNLASGDGNTIRWNLIADNRGPGLDLANQSTTTTVENNTIVRNALAAGTEQFGVRITNQPGATNNRSAATSSRTIPVLGC